jgi:hypothetical protein
MPYNKVAFSNVYPSAMTNYLGHSFIETPAWRAKRKLTDPETHQYRFIGF